MLSISVLVPTYRRPEDLQRCLIALKCQLRAADEILVTVRNCDTETWQLLDEFEYDGFPLKPLKLNAHGVVHALNAGLAAATGDIVAITDDDAAPHTDWLQRIESHFEADSTLGAVGGRDILYKNGEKITFDDSQTVGKLQWFGRTVGNHHCGVGEVREVDILKGVNMSYRRTAIGALKFDSRLRGHGAQVCNDMAFSLAVCAAGWTVIYDPAILVDHYPAPRFDEDKRNMFNEVAFSNKVYNETITVLSFLTFPRRIVFLIWMILIGTRESLGLFQLFRLMPIEGSLAFRKWVSTFSGRFSAYKNWIMKEDMRHGAEP